MARGRVMALSAPKAGNEGKRSDIEGDVWEIEVVSGGGDSGDQRSSDTAEEAVLREVWV